MVLLNVRRYLKRLAMLGVGLDRIPSVVYREILGREPTTAEFDNFIRHASLFRPDTTVGALLKNVLGRHEAESKLGLRLLGQSIQANPTGEQTFSYVLSLGTHCYTTSMLERQQLRRFSAPFDWLFSNLGMIEHCLRDDFRIFLSPQYYALVPHKERSLGPTDNVCDHSYYLENFGQRFVFNHTDPTTEKGYSYLTRCVDRMRRVLSSANRKLFVCVIPEAQFNEEKLRGILEVLKERTSNFEILCLIVSEPDPKAIIPVVTEITRDIQLKVFRQRPTSHLGGISFANSIDEVFLISVLRRRIFRLDTQLTDS